MGSKKKSFGSRAKAPIAKMKREGGRNDSDSQVKELHSQANALADKFMRGEGSNYIDEAIILDRSALELCPPDHPERSFSLIRLSIHLCNRYNQLGARDDLNEAIAFGREALSLCPPGHPNRSSSLNNLAIYLSTRYGLLGERDDLNTAIILGHKALSLHPQGHPDRSASLNNLASRLHSRYNLLGAREDLNEAIVLSSEALSLCPPGYPNRSASLSNLADGLSARYNLLGERDDLNKAIILSRKALSLHPPGYPNHSRSLNNLAVYLATRYNLLGERHDLNEMIFLSREALSLHPQGHPDRSTSLNNLALRLKTRYNLLGARDDLNEAIVLNREALSFRPLGHPHRSSSLSDLADDLRTRYNLLGARDDLNKAIVLNREALSLRPPGHPDRPMSFNNLAICLGSRYNLSGEREDLNEAIVFNNEALSLRPPGHPDRPISFDNLAICLSTRYKLLGARDDLNEAIVLSREALSLRPLAHPNRSASLNNLAVHLSTRHMLLGAMDDLNEAIVLDREALSLHPSGHPDRSASLNNLGRNLCTWFERSNQPNDKDEIFTLYAQLKDIPQMVSSVDLLAARAWVDVAEHFRHTTTVLAYETSLRLLIHHLATFPSLPQHLDILKSRTSSLAVDAFSACLRNSSPTKAVELLEQGRGVFWGQLTRLRSPVDDVISSGPAGKALADKFTYLTSLIHAALGSSGADQHDRVCRLNVVLQGVVDDIHKLPCLSRFLLPPLFSELQQAAREGPVIIVNASKYSCDALVVLPDRDPVHIPLKITKDHVQEMTSALHRSTVEAKLMGVSRGFVVLLRQIWDEVVSPIVDFLRTIHPPHSRIWWCPTAEFCLLPLHAAGQYRKGQPKLADLYISSYTPTLTALIHARRHERPAEMRRFIAIGQANGKGEKELPSVGAELASIAQRVDGLTAFSRIEGSESCISQVAEALGKNDWVHFACHGIPNRERPFESAFALYDGRFTIEHIMRCEPQNAQFAYLSACHTTVGDEKCPDEMIHLASAMQHVGFRSVIGTMWAVDDEHTGKITSMFYDNIVDESGQLDHKRAAFALHKTMRTLTNISFDQRLLYVHLGA